MNATRNKFLSLGIEGGGTKTTWILLDENFNPLAQGKEGPGNYVLAGREGLRKIMKSIAKQIPRTPDVIGICLASCHNDRQKREIELDAKAIWPKATKVLAGEDTKSGFYGAHGNSDGILVIAGTGSNSFGKKGSKFLKAGGWGHIFSDEGSAYQIAVEGLKQSFKEYNRTGKTVPLAKALMKHGDVGKIEDLVSLVLSNGSKDYVASYGWIVAVQAEKGDKLAQKILVESANALADNVAIVAKRLGLKNPAVATVGSMLEKRKNYFDIFKKAVKKRIPAKTVFASSTPGEVGAICFALNTKIEVPKKKA